MTKWLAPALDYIPQWLDYQVQAGRIPGIGFAIASGGKVVLERAFGQANVTSGEKLTPDHRFRVASHSKTFTVAGIMKLVEAGKLRLDDKAGQYVPGLHKAVAKATIAQLASHTAGITRDGTDSGQWADRRPFLNAEELLAALAEPPILPANTRMKYSNHGFGLLGLIIAAVTGEPYNDWIAREVIAPAGLARTQPDAPVAKGVPFASGHASHLLLGQRYVIPATNPTHALASATGFVSTAGDLAQFFAQLNPAAKKSILSVESRREMARRQWKVMDQSIERHYGLGTIHGDCADWAWFGHSGGFQGVISQTATVPSQDLTVSVLTNASDGPAGFLLDGTLRILQAFARSGPPAKGLADWSGRWWGLSGASDLIAMGSKVLVATPGLYNPFMDATELAPAADGTAKITKAGGFAHPGETMRLERDKKGKVVAFWLAGHRLQPHAAVAKEARERYLGG
jgi:CubicO group peptidase (beta-lactamase class C family)